MAAVSSQPWIPAWRWTHLTPLQEIGAIWNYRTMMICKIKCVQWNTRGLTKSKFEEFRKIFKFRIPRSRLNQWNSLVRRFLLFVFVPINFPRRTALRGWVDEFLIHNSIQFSPTAFRPTLWKQLVSLNILDCDHFMFIKTIHFTLLCGIVIYQKLKLCSVGQISL